MRIVKVVSLAGVAVLIAAFGYGAEQEKRDSGRYSFDASCREKAGFANCQVVVRDLVYDTVFVDQALSTTPEVPRGSTGRSVSFQTHPAQGSPQRITVALGPVDEAGAGGQVELLVQIDEGEHIMQRYSLAFPVVKTQKP